MDLVEDYTAMSHNQLLEHRDSLSQKVSRLNAQAMNYPKGSTPRNALNSQVMRLQSELSLIKQELRIKHQQNEPVTKDKHIVTDHALVRYLERVHGINVEAVKDKIIRDVKLPMGHVNDKAYCYYNGFLYIFGGGKLVTVLSENESYIERENRDTRSA